MLFKDFHAAYEPCPLPGSRDQESYHTILDISFDTRYLYIAQVSSDRSMIHSIFDIAKYRDTTKYRYRTFTSIAIVRYIEYRTSTSSVPVKTQTRHYQITKSSIVRYNKNKLRKTNKIRKKCFGLHMCHSRMATICACMFLHSLIIVFLLQNMHIRGLYCAQIYGDNNFVYTLLQQ